MTLSRMDRVLLGLCIAGAVIFLCSHPLKENQFGPRSDEGYYFHYAKTVEEKGLRGFQELLSWFSQSQQARLHPPPSRIGFVLTGAFLFHIFGPSYSILGIFSTACFILFLAVVFYFIRKYFDLDAALLTTLLLSTSPLLMGMARRALMDSALNLLWALTVWLFLEFLIERKIFQYALFLLSFILAVLFKEGSLILLPFFVFVMVFARRMGLQKIPWKYIIAACLCGVIVPMALYILILGGMDVSIQALQCLEDIQRHIVQFNPYVANYCMGPWYRYLLDFMLLNPIVTLLFIGYSFRVVLTPPDAKKIYLLTYFLVTYAALTFIQNNKNIRYAMSLEMVMGLFAVFMLYEIFGRRMRGTTYVTAAAVIIYFVNFISFIDIFEIHGVLDPITRHLLGVRNFIPL